MKEYTFDIEIAIANLRNIKNIPKYIGVEL